MQEGFCKKSGFYPQPKSSASCQVYQCCLKQQTTTNTHRSYLLFTDTTTSAQAFMDLTSPRPRRKYCFGYQEASEQATTALDVTFLSAISFRCNTLVWQRISVDFYDKTSYYQHFVIFMKCTFTHMFTYQT